MAQVHVTLSRVDDRGDTGGALPVITSAPTAAQTLTSSGTPATSTIAADRADGLVWTITARGGDVFAAFGDAPAPGPDIGHLILAGQTRDFSVTKAGEKVAVVNA